MGAHEFPTSDDVTLDRIYAAVRLYRWCSPPSTGVAMVSRYQGLQRLPSCDRSRPTSEYSVLRGRSFRAVPSGNQRPDAVTT